MNRKLVNGLLLLSCATVGCGTFTSCKDTDEDFKNEVLISQDEYYKKLIEYIDTNIESCECPEDTKAILDAIREFLGASVDGKYPENAVNDKVDALISGFLNRTFGSGYTTWLNQSNLSNLVHSTDKEYVDMGNNVAALLKFKQEQEETNNQLEADVEIALAQARTAYLEALGANNAIQDLDAALVELKAALEKLQPQIDAINERLNKLITNILVQQTYNPLFGTINLPIGLQSNINANYYGVADHALKFPFGDEQYEYNGDQSVLNNEAVAAAIASLNPQGAVAIQANVPYIEDSEANLGNLYLTINPNTVDFTGVKLSLVNSKDEAAPVVDLKPVKENDKVLDFGFDLTRSAENNGFYRVPVQVEAANAPALSIKIESGLKSAMKDALLNHTKQDFVALGKVLLDQMNGFLPAYGVKSTWTTKATVDGQEVSTEHSVYSNYNLAVATVHPLGYAFLYGEGTNKELPTFGAVTDKLHEFFNDIRKDITFNLDLGIDENKYQINLDLSKIEFNVGIDKLTVVIPSMPIYEPGHEGDDNFIVGRTEETPIELTYNGDGTVSGNEGALNGLVDAINNAVKDMLTGDANSIQSVINTEVVNKMNDLIADLNGQLKGINNQINDQIGDILDKIENQLAGKLDKADKLVEKYNALANKINNFLKNPNHYLQVMMAYSTGNGDLHHLSTTLKDPSRFVQGSGNAIELFATSYTGELVAPSYKKYVAITRAFNGETPVSINANEVSNNAGLNKVIPGRQQRVALNASALQKGLTYEIVYTSLDYRGYTSTRLYYVTVK